jgi:hypothetical protein
MAPDEYSKALDKALSDLYGHVQQRDLLNADIAGLRETVRVLSTLVQLPSDKQQEIAKVLAMADYATPSLTNAIRSLLVRESPAAMTAIEVRNALDESSDSDSLNISLSACHAALKRMLSDEQVELGIAKNGKATYRYVLKMDPVPVFGLASEYSNLVSLAALATLDPNKVKESARSIHPADQITNRPAHEQAMRDAIGRKSSEPRAPRPPNFKK